MRANHPISHNSPFPHRGFPQLDTWLVFFQQLFQPFLQYSPCLPIFCQCFPISCWVLLLHDLIHSQQLSQSWWLPSIYLFIFGCYLLSSSFISYYPLHITGQMSGHILSITKMQPLWALVLHHGTELLLCCTMLEDISTIPAPHTFSSRFNSYKSSHCFSNVCLKLGRAVLHTSWCWEDLGRTSSPPWERNSSDHPHVTHVF